MTNFFQNVIITLSLQSSFLKLLFPEVIVDKFGTKNTNVGGLQKFISLYSWKNTFENLSNNEKVDLYKAIS